MSPLSPLAESFTPQTTSEEQQTQRQHTDDDLDRSPAMTGLSETETSRDSIKCKIATIGTASPIEIGKPVAMADVAEPRGPAGTGAGGPVVAGTQLTAVTDRTGASGPRRSETGAPVMTGIRFQIGNDRTEASDSPWASPVVLVTKKDGSTRFCVDYRRLNSLTVKDAYPLPRIDDSLRLLGNQQWFSTMDLASGYWQVAMSPEAKRKAAFVTNEGLFQFRVMPFGLCNAPATFERLMDRVLCGMRWSRCLVYLDDVISFGKTVPEAIWRLEEVLARLSDFGLQLKAKKCTFMQTEVGFLGHIVGRTGLACDPEKLSAVRNWHEPTRVKGVRQFVGFVGYYRPFLKNLRSWRTHWCY